MIAFTVPLSKLRFFHIPLPAFISINPEVIVSLTSMWELSSIDSRSKLLTLTFSHINSAVADGLYKFPYTLRLPVAFPETKFPGMKLLIKSISAFSMSVYNSMLFDEKSPLPSIVK